MTGTTFNNTILGEKVFNDSYPDGRAFCWMHLQSGYTLENTKIKFSKDGRKIYKLMKLPETATNPAEMFKKHNQKINKNNVHFIFLKPTLERLKEQHAKAMQALVQDIKVPQGWTAECIFELPFEAHRYFVDEHGERTKKIHFSKDAMRFWIKDINGPVDSDDEFEAEYDAGTQS
jgi:hypothetical protein